MIEHRSAVHTLSQLERMYPMLDDDAFLLKTTFTFDFSVPELFSWFFGQGKLVILPQGLDKDPAALLKAVEQHRSMADRKDEAVPVRPDRVVGVEAQE